MLPMLTGNRLDLMILKIWGWTSVLVSTWILHAGAQLLSGKDIFLLLVKLIISGLASAEQPLTCAFNFRFTGLL